MQKVKIIDIKPNPNNPRLIKDDKFKKLCQSIKDFPEMLELRPIVVNKDMMPIKATKENYYRASIVYYTLENMKHCYPFKMEVERLKKVSTERARKRADNKDPRTK